MTPSKTSSFHTLELIVLKVQWKIENVFIVSKCDIQEQYFAYYLVMFNQKNYIPCNLLLSSTEGRKGWITRTVIFHLWVNYPLIL